MAPTHDDDRLFDRYYGMIIPCLLNVVLTEGYLVLVAITSGQTLAALSDHLTNSLGIIIASIVTFLVSLCHPH